MAVRGHPGPQTRRAALLVSLERVKESAAEMARVENSLDREAFRREAELSALIRQACQVLHFAMSQHLGRIENQLRRQAERAGATIAKRGRRPVREVVVGEGSE